MPMLKKASDVTNGIGQGQPETKKESGLEAAVDRLTKVSTAGTTEVVKSAEAEGIKAYKPRDFDAEARGKTRCLLFAAALQSPSLAGMKWKTPEEFFDLVEKSANRGVKYSFQD